MYLFTRGQALGAGNPGPRFFHVDDSGVLTNLFSLEFQVFDRSNDTRRAMPLQVYPSSVGTRATVDVGTDAPTGDRDGPGRYTARWTVPTLEPIGLHMIRWFWKAESTSAEQTADQPFDIGTLAAPASYLLALPSDIRAECIPSSGPAAVSDLRVLAALQAAGAFIERFTRRRFGARYGAVDVDGGSAPGLVLGTAEPLIAVEQLQYREASYTIDEFVSNGANYRIYNRHLRGLTDPDDRDNPRLELYDYTYGGHGGFVFGGYRFPEGRQNIRIRGVFGYTEADGTPFGGIPLLLRGAATSLAMRYLASKATSSGASYPGAIKSESTREQSVTYAVSDNNPAFVGQITGDPLVDQVLLMLRAPAAMGAA